MIAGTGRDPSFCKVRFIYRYRIVPLLLCARGGEWMQTGGGGRTGLVDVGIDDLKCAGERKKLVFFFHELGRVACTGLSVRYTVEFVCLLFVISLLVCDRLFPVDSWLVHDNLWYDSP